jgi:UDP-glucose 4-epimerase
VDGAVYHPSSEETEPVDFSGKAVVVTGGAGFIGSHVVDAMVARGAKVTVIDNFSTGYRELVHEGPQVALVEADLLDYARVARALAGHHFVFHLAANADVRDGLLHPRKDVEQNILVTQNVLEAMRENGIRHVAFSSTGALYGDTPVLPTPEDAPFPIQTSLYGASKIAAEGLLTAYAFGYGFQTWIFRFVSLLGPRYSHGHIIDFWRKLRANPHVLDVLGDGHQKKSYLHVSDCVRAMLVAIDEVPEASFINVFNLGHPGMLEVNESIGIISRELGVKPELRYSGGERGWIGDAPRILLDTRRIESLGWAPSKTIEESVVETLRFIEANPFLHTPSQKRVS